MRQASFFGDVKKEENPTTFIQRGNTFLLYFSLEVCPEMCYSVDSSICFFFFIIQAECKCCLHLQPSTRSYRIINIYSTLIRINKPFLYEIKNWSYGEVKVCKQVRFWKLSKFYRKQNTGSSQDVCTCTANALSPPAFHIFWWLFLPMNQTSPSIAMEDALCRKGGQILFWMFCITHHYKIH